jgi:hypothetical protein
MKKRLFIMTALLVAIVMGATAQNMSSQRRAQLVASSTKFALIKDGKNKKNWFAVMYFPVSYGDYYGVTGVNKRPRNESITDVMMMSDTDKKKFLKALNAFDKKMKFHIASTSELYKALNLHYNIQSENGPYSIATKGFYLVTDYTGYQRMKALAKKYGTPGGGGGVG